MNHSFTIIDGERLAGWYALCDCGWISANMPYQLDAAVQYVRHVLGPDTFDAERAWGSLSAAGQHAAGR